MASNLFQYSDSEAFSITLHYDGPSFRGSIAAGALGRELLGLEGALSQIAVALKKQKKISISPSDIQLVIAPFEDGSFREKALIVIRNIEKYPGTAAFAVGVANLIVVTLIGTTQIVLQLRAEKIRVMSPATVSEIGDQVKVSLLQDPEFLNNIAELIRPIQSEGDSLSLQPTSGSTQTIAYGEHTDFLELAGERVVELDEGAHSEELAGRITRVDIGATKNHIGFKIDGEGNTIPASLPTRMSVEELKSLLGSWIHIQCQSYVENGVRVHIDIDNYRIIEQPAMFQDDQ